MNKNILVFFFFSLCFGFIYAQDVINNEADNEKKETIIEEFEEKKALILYGLEGDLINLIKELKEKEDDRFNDELVDVLSNTRSSTLKTSIVDFFASRHLNPINSFVLEILENMDSYKNIEVNTSLYYVGENQVKEAVPYILYILENERFEFAESAINALGKIGGEKEALRLIEFYQNIAMDDAKKEIILKEAVMRALENLSFAECFDFLLEIIEDENENVVVRSLAVSALSKIQSADVFSKLVVLYSSSEPLIRASAIKSISKFDSGEARNLIVQACKDSQYKVRLEAINAINFTSDNVCDVVLYRAKTDPEVSIKILSIEKLVFLNCSVANDWLIKTFNDDNASLSIRVKIAKELLEKNSELIIKDVERVAIEAVSSDKYKKLAYELGRVLAKIKTDATSKIAESYIKSKDVLTRTLGLDMFALNRYSSVLPLVEELKNDSKAGALQKRAMSLINE
ncbi:MAG: HEAT repeat domain-containing protein [Treponema sp.]